MINYWNRYRSRKWSAADINRIQIALMSPYGAGGLLGILMYDAEQTKFGLESLLPVFLVLAPVCVGIQWWIYRHADCNIRTATSNLEHVLCALFFAGAFSTFGLGYVELINAETSASAPVIVQGPVVNLEWKRAGRYHGSAHHITVYFEGRNVTFSETERNYLDLKLGDVYRTEAQMGGLGHYWRPAHSFWR